MNSKEFWKLAKFAVVGGTTFLIQAGLYFVFTRFVFSDLPKLASFILALSIAAEQNYVSHRIWTFKDQKTDSGSTLRYVIVLLGGLVLNAGIFWLGQDVLHIYDMLVIVIAGAGVPFVTYLSHRYFTFRSTPLSAS